MERIGKPRHGRESRRLSDWEVSESNPVAELDGHITGCLDCARHDNPFVRLGTDL
jgi:hypothetical protein